MSGACATSVLDVHRDGRPSALIDGVYHERQFVTGCREDGKLGSTWFASATSVILIVEGSPSYTMRALESIQNQDLYDLQIVVVCRGVVAGVRHSLEVAADRDIHIDLIDVEDPVPGACLRAGFAASRGSQIIAMNANEWFAPAVPFADGRKLLRRFC